MKIALGMVMIAALSGASSTAAAQDGVVILTEDHGPGATTYDFEDDLVTGDLVRPDGELLNVRRRGRRASLIRVREHFLPELLKSVESL